MKKVKECYTICELREAWDNGRLTTLKLIHEVIKDENCGIERITYIIEVLIKKTEDKINNKK